MSSVHIRSLRRRDLTDVLVIERASFAAPWNEADFDATLRRPDCFGLVAERWQSLCGYVFGALVGDSAHLLNLAVAPQERRRGIGSQLVGELIERLHSSGRRLVAVLGERNLPAQLFYRAQGFRAVGVLRGFCNGTRDDAYLFEHRPGERVAPFCLRTASRPICDDGCEVRRDPTRFGRGFRVQHFGERRSAGAERRACNRSFRPAQPSPVRANQQTPNESAEP